MEFAATKSKKSLVFAELISALLAASIYTDFNEQILGETLFLIITLDPWYGDIIVYIQTQTFRYELS